MNTQKTYPKKQTTTKNITFMFLVCWLVVRVSINCVCLIVFCLLCYCVLFCVVLVRGCLCVCLLGGVIFVVGCVCVCLCVFLFLLGGGLITVSLWIGRDQHIEFRTNHPR